MVTALFPTVILLQDMKITVICFLLSDIKKLQHAGLQTIGAVLQKSSRDLVNIKGILSIRSRFKDYGITVSKQIKD